MISIEFLSNKNLYNHFFILVCKCVYIILIVNIPFNNKESQILSKKITIKNEYNFPYVHSIYDIFNHIICQNSILIFEPFQYHYECTPGFSKYFIDLGYKVHIIMHNSGLTSFCSFEPINKIRFFIYNNIEEIKKHSRSLSIKFFKYNYILIETANPYYFMVYKELNLLNIDHSFFVFHHLEYVISVPTEIKLRKNQIWSLGNFKNAVRINPHYFGKFKITEKNKITRFFITSTIERNYNKLISAVEKFKDENLKFHVNVVGKWNTFTIHNISEKMRDHFTFKYNVSYSELYNEVVKSDYIIINLDPNNEKDIPFKNTRISGSVQLAYGFLKPVIINKDFAEIYNFNSNNSFIYDNDSFITSMRQAINIGNNNYKKMQENLKLISNNIYEDSLNNLKNCMSKL